jgi:hypothetical protein
LDPEPCAEDDLAERPPGGVLQERQLRRRHRIERLLQRRQDRDAHRLMRLPLVLLLNELELAVLDVLTAEADHVANPLPGVEQEGK